ncbi:HIT family protein [Bacteriovoracaceae bacterium]|nr:HIT family protein [Bacteriovoracaceae bacterium]
MSFKLHPQLEIDSHTLAEFNLCKVLLINDSNYPWLCLVPKRENISELHELEENDEMILLSEIMQTSRILKKVFQADKINIAALGNMVSQLHVHVIARYKSDVAWPSPIWGKVEMSKYTPEQLIAIKEKLKDLT